MRDAFSLRFYLFRWAFQHCHFFQDEVVRLMPNSQPGRPGFEFVEEPSPFPRCGAVFLAPLHRRVSLMRLSCVIIYLYNSHCRMQWIFLDDRVTGCIHFLLLSEPLRHFHSYSIISTYAYTYTSWQCCLTCLATFITKYRITLCFPRFRIVSNTLYKLTMPSCSCTKPQTTEVCPLGRPTFRKLPSV